MALEKVILRKAVLDSILTYSKMNHPKEGILLLRGKSRKGVVEVESVVVPPSAVHGQGFSAFSWWMLPIDLSYVGVAHSHPSGHAVPSHQDLLHLTGRIMVIVGYPYEDERSVAVYDLNGKRVQFEVK